MYKRNVTIRIGNLHRSKRILSDFTKEKIIMKNKFQKVDFPTKFIDSIVKSFQYNERTKGQQGDLIIPPYLLEEPKPQIEVKFPICELNEKEYLYLGKKFNCFLSDSYDLNVLLKTKKVNSSFPLEDKNLHP